MSEFAGLALEVLLGHVDQAGHLVRHVGDCHFFLVGQGNLSIGVTVEGDAIVRWYDWGPWGAILPDRIERHRVRSEVQIPLSDPCLFDKIDRLVSAHA